MNPDPWLTSAKQILLGGRHEQQKTDSGWETVRERGQTDGALLARRLDPSTKTGSSAHSSQQRKSESGAPAREPGNGPTPNYGRGPGNRGRADLSASRMAKSAPRETADEIEAEKEKREWARWPKIPKIKPKPSAGSLTRGRRAQARNRSEYRAKTASWPRAKTGS
jgi:hypothetical protein